MPVRTEDFDKAKAEVIGTFDGVEEIWEGIVNYYLKERHIGGLAGRLWKITAVLVKVPVAMNFFLQRVDYDWAIKYSLILPFVLYWEVVIRLSIFCGLFLFGMICPLMRVESIFLDLFWNVNFFIAAK